MPEWFCYMPPIYIQTFYLPSVVLRLCLWIKLVYQPLDGRFSSTGMVLSHEVSDRMALSAALCSVPFSGAFCVFLNIPLSADSSTRLHDYYSDHSSQWKTIPAVIICHYTIKFLPLKKTAWRCLLLFWACRSRVPSRVSKYSPIRRFKYVTSWLLFRSLVSITLFMLSLLCHCNFKFLSLEEFPSFLFRKLLSCLYWHNYFLCNTELRGFTSDSLSHIL